ncbi:CRISPR-associated protein Cas5 [Variovorax paradoxus]|nr:CRISPR-associated protein Cas5 [Variovorax paradoxus]
MSWRRKMRIGESPSLPVPGPPACARERPSP